MTATSNRNPVCGPPFGTGTGCFLKSAVRSSSDNGGAESVAEAKFDGTSGFHGDAAATFLCVAGSIATESCAGNNETLQPAVPNYFVSVMECKAVHGKIAVNSTVTSCFSSESRQRFEGEISIILPHLSRPGLIPEHCTQPDATARQQQLPGAHRAPVTVKPR